MRFWWMILWMGCAGPDDSGQDTDGVSEACALAEQNSECPECDDGPVTCSYGEFSETENSCGDCQARSALYQALCDAGVEDSSAQIEADTECESAQVPACALVETLQEDCTDAIDADIDYTCTYGEYSHLDEGSMGECWAEIELVQVLCDAGVPDSAEAILAELECVEDPNAACELAEQYANCLECDDGLVTCTFEEFSASENSCGDCQALGALYQDMCDEGVSATMQVILDGTECTDPVIVEE